MAKESLGSVGEVSADNSWFIPALGLTFIALRLAGFISWSWWWVLSPFWIPLTLVMIVFLAVALANAFKN